MSDKTWVETWNECVPRQLRLDKYAPYYIKYGAEMSHKLDLYEDKEKARMKVAEESREKNGGTENGSHDEYWKTVASGMAIEEKAQNAEDYLNKRRDSLEAAKNKVSGNPEPITRLDYFAARAPVAPKWFKPTIVPNKEIPLPLCHNDDKISRYHRERVFQWPWVYAKAITEARPKENISIDSSEKGYLDAQAKKRGSRMTDMQKFIDLYKGFGIEMEPVNTGGGHFMVQMGSNIETSSDDIILHAFFDANGKFLNHGFFE